MTLVERLRQYRGESWETTECYNGLRDEAATALEAAERERDELQAAFDLRWDADMRAIKVWQAAGEGRELSWPDHADLVVWLLIERDTLAAQLAQAREALEDGLRLRGLIAESLASSYPDEGSAHAAEREAKAIEDGMRALAALSTPAGEG